MIASCDDDEEAAAATVQVVGKDVNEADVASPGTKATVDDEAEGASRELQDESPEISRAADEGTLHEPDATAPNELIGCEDVAINGGANLTNGIVLDEGVLIVIG